MRWACTALLMVSLVLPASAGAQQLGRLFFTPEQRAALDARRRQRLPDKPAPVAISPTTRVDGYVKRSHGKSTIWLDGSPIADGVRPDGIRVSRGSDPTRVRIGVGDESRQVTVRVGQTVDRATGEINDAIGSGTVRIERREVPR
jgi:hypothetical protein